MSITVLKVVAVLAIISVLLSLSVSLAAGVRASTSLTYYDRPGIKIVGDSGFNETNGVVSGSGRSDDPYIIEGWYIGGPLVSTAIAIYDANAHFAIRNVYLHDCGIGVALYNTSHANVYDCWIANASVGVSIIGSASCDIHDNTIRDNYYGITVRESNNIRLASNHYSGNTVNVQRPSFPWEQTWLGSAVCVAILGPLLLIIGAAVYVRVRAKRALMKKMQELVPPEIRSER
jgi:parallel beta-helix repeat protein